MRDKRAKFVELANNRVTRAIKDMRLIGNLSSRANYDYNDEDVKRILRTLQKQIEILRTRFSSGGGGSDAEFKIDE
jgi:transcription elongation GreA/GreB family factor